MHWWFSIGRTLQVNNEVSKIEIPIRNIFNEPNSKASIVNFELHKLFAKSNLVGICHDLSGLSRCVAALNVIYCICLKSNSTILSLFVLNIYIEYIRSYTNVIGYRQTRKKHQIYHTEHLVGIFDFELIWLDHSNINVFNHIQSLFDV